MLFNNLAFFPGFTFFSKGVWQHCGCQHSYSQRQKLLYGFRSKWPVRHKSKWPQPRTTNALWIW